MTSRWRCSRAVVSPEHRRQTGTYVEKEIAIMSTRKEDQENKSTAHAGDERRENPRERTRGTEVKPGSLHSRHRRFMISTRSASAGLQPFGGLDLLEQSL